MVNGCYRILLLDGTTPPDPAPQVLIRMGYDVLVAPDVAEACRLVEQDGGCIDLVFVSTAAADPGRANVLARLKELDSSLKVLVTDGYSEFAPVCELLKEYGCFFLQKPFDNTQLAETLHRMLA